MVKNSHNLSRKRPTSESVIYFSLYSAGFSGLRKTVEINQRTCLNYYVWIQHC